MNTYQPHMAARFSQSLATREAELSGILRAVDQRSEASGQAARNEVEDFKDVANEQTQSVVDDAQAEQAAHELEQVLAARQRLADGSFGICLDCGMPLDLRRLDVLPWTPCCTACQATREKAQPARH